MKVSEVLDAIERNSTPKTQKYYAINIIDNGIATCSVGEAALFFKVQPSTLAWALQGIEVPDIDLSSMLNIDVVGSEQDEYPLIDTYPQNLNSLIQSLSEATMMQKDEIARFVREHLTPDILDEEVVIQELRPFDLQRFQAELGQTDRMDTVRDEFRVADPATFA